MDKVFKINLWIIFLLHFFSVCIIGKMDTEFPQHNTDQYNYYIQVQEEMATEKDKISIQEPKIITNVLYNHYFNSGKTKIKITKSIQNDKIITTTEKWTTKNPSYLTWVNGLLIVTCLSLQYIKYLTAYHESGHALMAALVLDDNAAAKYVTINSSFGMFGSFAYVQWKNPSEYMFRKEELLEYLKRKTMIFLSGGIGMDIYRQKRLPPSEFLDGWQTFMKGMGSLATINFETPDDDLSEAIHNAQLYALIESDQYSRSEDGKIYISGETDGDQIIKIIGNFYEDAYDILDAHKDRLNTMANALYFKGTIHSPEIYDIAGMNCPKKN